MDMLGLLIAVVIAIPVLAIVRIVLTLGTREHVKRLEFRLASLETRLAGTAGEAPAPKPVSAPTPEALPAASEPPEAKIEAPPTPSGPEPPAAAPAPPAPAARPKISLEERFGTQWVVWAGGIALALGGARLLATALLFVIVFGLGAGVDPWQTGEPVGGPFINLVLLGYGIPALLAGVLAYVTRDARSLPSWRSGLRSAISRSRSAHSTTARC